LCLPSHILEPFLHSSFMVSVLAFFILEKIHLNTLVAPETPA